ncbi:MAG: hypothetical protein RL701_6848, partial [Pseudomonadota bacterium]
ARAQVERARHDPQSVELANELFGDLTDATTSVAQREPPHDAERVLRDLSTPAPAPKLPSLEELSVTEKIPSLEDLMNPTAAYAPVAFSSETASASGRAVSLPPGLVAAERPSVRTHRASVAAAKANAQNQEQPPLLLGLASSPPLGGDSSRPARSSRGLWIGVLSALFVVVAVGVFVLLRTPGAKPDATPAAAAANGTATPPEQTSSAQAAAPATTTAAAVATPVALSVRSTPAGADVFVDGQAQGKTPVILPLQAGANVELKLSAHGYVSKSEKLAIVAGMDAREIALEALRYELVVTTDPPGAIVSAVGRTAESPTPLVLSRVDAVVPISVEKAGFQRVVRSVRPDEFQEHEDAFRAELSLTLTPAPVVRRRAAAPAARALSLEPPAPEAKAENPEAEGSPVVQVKATGEAAAKPEEAAPAQPPAAAPEPAKPDAPPAETPKAVAPEPSAPPPPAPPSE